MTMKGLMDPGTSEPSFIYALKLKVYVLEVFSGIFCGVRFVNPWHAESKNAAIADTKRRNIFAIFQLLFTFPPFSSKKKVLTAIAVSTFLQKFINQ